LLSKGTEIEKDCTWGKDDLLQRDQITGDKQIFDEAQFINPDEGPSPGEK